MPPVDKVEAILARFPGPVTMPVDRRKTAAVLLLPGAKSL